MATITVRGLDETVERRLAEQAAHHGHSVEDEVREILTQAVQRPHIGLALMRSAQELGGVEELAIPERTDTARAMRDWD